MALVIYGPSGTTTPATDEQEATILADLGAASAADVAAAASAAAAAQATAASASTAAAAAQSTATSAGTAAAAAQSTATSAATAAAAAQATAAAAYVKPVDGVPRQDLDHTIRGQLDLADTALQPGPLPAGTTLQAAQISDATVAGRAVLTAADQAAQRSAMGAMAATLAGWQAAFDAAPAGEQAAARASVSGGGTIVANVPAIDTSAIITYAQLVAHIDTWATDATKLQIGTASDGQAIYAYTWGNHADTTLILSGTHGDEVTGVFTTMQCVRHVLLKSHSALVLGKRLIWVPVVSPSGFRQSRRNSNLVDVNRNYGLGWSFYVPPNAQYYKGAAAFSEGESRAVKSLLDTYNVRVMLDCHNTGVGELAADLGYVAPPTAAPSDSGVIGRWISGHARNYAATWAELVSSQAVEPTTTGWAQWYSVRQKLRLDFSAATLECAADLRGCTPTNITTAAATLYAAAIVEYLRAAECVTMSVPTYSWQARRNTEAATTSIASGGTRLDVTGTETSITFDQMSPQPTGLPKQNISVFLPCPGAIEILADGYLESAGTGEQRVDIGIGFNEAAVESSTWCSITVPATSGMRVPFVLSTRLSVPAPTIDAVTDIRMRFLKIGATQNPLIKRCRLSARFVPSWALSRAPLI